MFEQVMLKALEPSKQKIEKEMEKTKDFLKRAKLSEGFFQRLINESSEKLKHTKDKVPCEAAIESATYFRDKFRLMIEEYSKQLKLQEEDYELIMYMINSVQKEEY